MKKVFLLSLLFLSVSCQMKTQGKEGVQEKSLQEQTTTISKPVTIGKVADEFKFQTVETGWRESTRKAGTMFAEVRLLIKNVSSKAVKDIPALQNQLTYKFLDENNIVIDESFQSIQSNVIPAWEAGQQKYVTLVSTPSFRNFTEKYKAKVLYVEIYYHDVFVWKGKIQSVIVDWD